MKARTRQSKVRRPKTKELLCAFLTACVCVAGCAAIPGRERAAEQGVVSDPVSLLKEYNAHIIEQSPAAAAVKFQKMSGNLFVFYRGTSDVFYEYAACYGIDKNLVPGEGARVQLHGDYHLENFGAFRSESGEVTFDLLDFDDTFRGPYILDLRRMAVAIIIACEEKGLFEKADEMVDLFLQSYARTLQEIAAGQTPVNFCYRAGADIPIVNMCIQKASKIDRHQFLEKGCKTNIGNDGVRGFIEDRGYSHVGKAGFVKAAMGQYLDTVLPDQRRDDEFYAIKDVVLSNKSGIGSAGKLKYLVLVEGPTPDQYDDVVLEFKEERCPVWAEGYGDIPEHNGRRVFMGFYVLQSENFPCIGYTAIGGRDLFVSEMTPYYREFEIDDISTPADMRDMATVAGKLIAKGHVRGAEDTAGAAAALAGAAEREDVRASVLTFSRECYRYFKRGFEGFRERLKEYPLLLVLARV